MKQFDTIQDNEWLPTEDDIEGTIQVVDTLPTASATYKDRTFLLNGTMDGYTKTHFYKCEKTTIDGVETYVWTDLNVGKFSVGNCTDIRLMMFDDGLTYRVLISWKDPADVVIGDERILWKETRLVHQVGHMPIDVNDGIETFTCAYRDQYATFGSFSHSFASDNRKHYFKLFPVSEDGAITNDDANGRVAGYNYVLTGDSAPVFDYDTGVAEKTYYSRTFDSETQTYSYTQLEWNTDNFDGSGTSDAPWKFKANRAYYEYQNAYITWAGIRDLIRNGEAPKYFPIGNIITLPYHGDFGEMAFEVVDYDTVQPADPSVHHTMTLESKYLNRWWDYNGGVVFDTNEVPAMPTPDTSRNTDKVYFARIIGSTNSVPTGEVAGTAPNCYYNPALNDTVAVKNFEITGSYALYAETIFDSHDAASNWKDVNFWPNYGRVFGISNTILSSELSGSPGFNRGDLWECELPYTSERRNWMSDAVSHAVRPNDPRATVESTLGNATSAANINGYASTKANAELHVGQFFVWNTTTNANLSVTVYNESTNSTWTQTLYCAQACRYRLKKCSDGKYMWVFHNTFTSATAANAANAFDGLFLITGEAKSTMLDYAERYVGVVAAWEVAAATNASFKGLKVIENKDGSTSTDSQIEVITETRHIAQWTALEFDKALVDEDSTTRTYIYHWKPVNHGSNDSNTEHYDALYPFPFPSDLRRRGKAPDDLNGRTYVDDCGISVAAGGYTPYYGTVHLDFLQEYTRSVAEGSTTTGTDFKNSVTAAEANGWGPEIWPAQGKGRPRSNAYADRWRPVPLCAQNYFTDYFYNKIIKYFIPVEQEVLRHRSVCAKNSKTAYATIRRKSLRDCSEDLDQIFRLLGSANKDNLKNLRVNDSYVTDDGEGDAATKDVPEGGDQGWTGDHYLKHAGNSSSARTYTYNISAILQNLLKFPTHDDVFMKGKHYWKVHYLKLSELNTSNFSFNYSPVKYWYYRSEGELPDGSTRYSRARHDEVITTAGGTTTLANDGYVGAFVRVDVLDADGSVPTGWTADTHGVVGLYWRKIDADSHLFVDTPYFKTVELTAANLFENGLNKASDTDLYEARYFFPKNRIIPNTGSMPYAVDDGGTLKFTDGDWDATAGNYQFYGANDVDLRGLSPVLMNSAAADGGPTPDSASTWSIFGYPGYSSVYNNKAPAAAGGMYGIRTTDFFEGAVSQYDAGLGNVGWDGETIIPYNGSTTASGSQVECNIYIKTPNTERVAYGNHVWAQSNLRVYYNGPFDSSSEFLPTADGIFRSTLDYYVSSGTGFTRLYKGSVNSATTYIAGTLIAQWQTEQGGTQVYTRYPGGRPVGYKLDINRPEKYHEYGLSPVMQYEFNETTGTWEPKYTIGSCWYSSTFYASGPADTGHVKGEPVGFPSVNNGLCYDRLADMFWSNCVLQGTNAGGSHAFVLSRSVARSTNSEGGVTAGGYTSDSMQILDNGQWTTLAGKNFDAAADSAARDVKFNQILPRQSFLHGFLDCKFKRTADITMVAGKDYYLKSPYGTYDKLDANSPMVTGGPYAHVLYELNLNYHADLAEAKEFLDSIVPVINHNGMYGTIAAYDFYPRSSPDTPPNLGGTTTIDKVWLMSTSQVNGGTGANNGIFENPMGPDPVTGSAILRKWASYGSSSSNQQLNAARVKNGLTLGAHGTSGYADVMAGAQYWWLRSAGGDVAINVVWETGMLRHTDSGADPFAPNRISNKPIDKQYILRLSPLVTLG